jgi:MoxR-like ATPase
MIGVYDYAFGRDASRLKVVCDEVARAFKGLENETAVFLAAYIATSPAGERSVPRHALLEGAPGTAKSELVRRMGLVLARWIDGREREESKALARIQGTSDLLPSDFVGREMKEAEGHRWSFSPGPLLRFRADGRGPRTPPTIFFADEVNRVSPRTLSVLLQAMAESVVEVPSLLLDEGERRVELRGLFVACTRNPEGMVGANPIPEPMVDRIMVWIPMPFPSASSMESIVLGQSLSLGDPDVGISYEEACKGVGSVVCTGDAARFIVQLTLATWPLSAARLIPNLEVPNDRDVRALVDGRVSIGVGVRAALALREMARSVAWLRGGNSIEVDDVCQVAPYVLAHRMRFVRERCSSPIEQFDCVRDLALTCRPRTK